MDKVEEIHLCELYEQGASVESICEEYDLSNPSFYRILKKYRVKLRGAPNRSVLAKMKDEDVEAFTADYNDPNMRVWQLCEKWNITPKTMYDILRTLQIPPKSLSKENILNREEQVKHAIKLYQEGAPIWKIEDLTGISQVILYKELHHRGVRMRHKGYRYS